MIENIEKELIPLRNKLKKHRLYQSLRTINDVQIFMENHVYAVWDFMSILKSLQRQLTNISLPWIPNQNPALARFINEVVCDEESDINEIGQPKSHFEMYLDAMEQINANRKQIDSFLDLIKAGKDIDHCLNTLNIDNRIREFTQHTFEIINTGKTHCIASAFTFGREDIIPGMFIEMLKELDPDNIHYNKFKYYLERHIEIDGELHGPISIRMIKELCNTNSKKWDQTIDIARNSLIKRIQLWDAIDDKIQMNNRK
tara:strand:- start:354 stop:1124 length:771 start_codon:yes stop_codon:yes gene_type:complete